MNNIFAKYSLDPPLQFYLALSNKINRLQPLALLLARAYVANVFFKSGLTKIRDWDTTLFLFEEEYQVPFLNFEFAAFLATAGELVLPVLLFFGLTSRFGAMGISIINVVAVLSLEEIAPAALSLHVIWGVLLLLIVLWGGGRLSMDHMIKVRLH